MHRTPSLLAFALLLALLAACSTAPAPRSSADYDSLLTVALADESPAQLAARYGGELLVSEPEAGFAVLGLRQPAEGLELSSLDANRNATYSPELRSSGWTAWGGGWTAWGGGWTAWGGGGTLSALAENEAAFAQVRLAEGQRLAPAQGRGVTVAVLDTGVDLSHPALRGHLAPERAWRDFVDGDARPQDEAGGAGYGHGTAVAGLLVQVAPEATLLPIRVLRPDGSGDLSALVQGIAWALAQGADILHLSLGSDEDALALRTLLAYAAARGTLVVASAGNGASARVTYPAAYGTAPGALGARLVSVGSVDGGDRLSAFSNYGAGLELYAPGERLHTLAPAAQTLAATGTSFAAPLVSGALALALGETRAAHPDDQALIATADPLAWASAGRLDVARYLRALGE